MTKGCGTLMTGSHRQRALLRFPGSTTPFDLESRATPTNSMRPHPPMQRTAPSLQKGFNEGATNFGQRSSIKQNEGGKPGGCGIVQRLRTEATVASRSRPVSGLSDQHVLALSSKPPMPKLPSHGMREQAPPANLRPRLLSSPLQSASRKNITLPPRAPPEAHEGDIIERSAPSSARAIGPIARAGPRVPPFTIAEGAGQPANSSAAPAQPLQPPAALSDAVFRARVVPLGPHRPQPSKILDKRRSWRCCVRCGNLFNRNVSEAGSRATADLVAQSAGTVPSGMCDACAEGGKGVGRAPSRGAGAHKEKENAFRQPLPVGTGQEIVRSRR